MANPKNKIHKTTTVHKEAARIVSPQKASSKPSPKRTQVKPARTEGAITSTKRANKNNNHSIHGSQPYKLKKGEKFMSDGMQKHFRIILMAWKRELLQEVDRTVHHMQDDVSNLPDTNDRATLESEFSLQLRTRDRERKLLKKIASALTRIDDKSYGYCEDTGEEIGLKRLEARPVATLCVEAQTRRERIQRHYSDFDR